MKTYQNLQDAVTAGVRVQIMAPIAYVIYPKILTQQPNFTPSETRRKSKPRASSW